MDQFKDHKSRSRSTADDTLQREKADELLRSLGADNVIIETVTRHIDGEKVRSVVHKLRVFAQDNPTVVLGALTALITGGAVAAGVVSKKRSKRRSRAAAAKKSAKRRSAPAAKASSAKRPSRPASKAKPARASAKRTLIEPHRGDKRYVRRDARGRIKESVDVGRSLAADRRHKSKTRAKAGEGDKGDR